MGRHTAFSGAYLECTQTHSVEVRGKAVRILRELIVNPCIEISCDWAVVQMWKFPELASSFVGALSPIGTMGKQFVLPGAIVCTALTSFQAGCKGQHVGDIMSQLVPRGSQGDMCWSCALPVLTGGRTDLLGSWNVLGPFLSGLSKQSAPAGLPPAARPPDLQASGSHCPPMPETLTVQDLI